MQLAEIVYIEDVDMRGVIEHVANYADMTVYSVRTICGTLYSREADELAVVTDDAERAQLRTDMLWLATTHPELIPAAALLAAVLIVPAVAIAAQLGAWSARHGLDKLPVLTAEHVLAARDADHDAALAIQRGRANLRALIAAAGR